MNIQFTIIKSFLAGVAIHSIGFDVTAQVHSTGLNVYGHLGNGSTLDATTPSPIALESIIAMAPGGTHTLALTANGMVWAWGNDTYGQVGDGPSTFPDINKLSPVHVAGITGAVKALAAGQAHSLALLQDGSIMAWGVNGNGQLGIGNNTQQASPVAVPGVSNAIAIAAGLRTSLALTSDGTVLRWGVHGHGFSSANLPTPVENLTGVVAIAGGHLHFLALRDDGSLWAWGFNDSGQLGNGTTQFSSTPVQVLLMNSSPIRAIAAGGHHSLALLDDGSVYAWGSNSRGQLGIGSTTNALEPTLVTELSDIIKISAGGSHSLALQAGGSVYAWGANTYGQLGDGTNEDRTTPANVSLPLPASGIAAGGHTSFMMAGPSPLCVADTNYDAAVNVQDLLKVISAWGPCPPPSSDCPDIAPSGGDGEINVLDLLAIINAWGACP